VKNADFMNWIKIIEDSNGCYSSLSSEDDKYNFFRVFSSRRGYSLLDFINGVIIT
jgi:hypothetical protein